MNLRPLLTPALCILSLAVTPLVAAEPKRGLCLEQLDAFPEVPKGAGLILQSLCANKGGEAELLALSVSPGTVVLTDKRARGTLFIYVLEGSSKLHGETRPLSPRDALVVSSVQPAQLQAGAEGLRALVARVGGTEDLGFSVTTAKATAQNAGKVRRAKDAAAYLIAQGAGWARMMETGSEASAYLGVLEAESSFSVKEHTHESSIELLHILEGQGLFRSPSGKDVEVGPGTSLVIPKGARHAFTLTRGPFRAVQLYVPPGPEERFKSPTPAADAGITP